jgi:adenine phosphoribosyltransferase|tara:strand:+ start:527 stop:1117 length:591 start_codon:yes stop_codon:yes gene_type:complete
MAWGEPFADEFYELDVAGLTRKLPKVKIHDELAIASFVMLGDTELIEECAEAIILHTDFPKDGIDILCTPEAKGIPLVHTIARRLKKDYVIARKGIKGYMNNPMIEKVQSITTIGAQTLVLDSCDVKKLEGKNVCIIDDVVSTGGSLIGLQAMLEKIDCSIICKAAVLLEEAGYDKGDIIFLEKLPIFKPNNDSDN